MKLQTKIREITGSKVKNLRKEDQIPAVLYGKGIKSVNLTVNLKEFSKIFKEAGENTVIDLVVDNNGKKENKNILVHSVQFDPISSLIIHADLYEVNMKEKVEANVPLVFEGESEAVKTENGVLVKNFLEVEVSALPGDLPQEIKIDLKALKTFSDVIKASDIKVSEAVELKMSGEETIASVMPPRSEEELAELSEEAAPADVSSVKVESEEKKAEEEKEASKE
jgi:large subunit ribosomal protein L25